MSSYESLTPLLAFRGLVGLAAEVGSGRLRLAEEAREHWLNDRSEHELGATGGGEGHPEYEDEFEGVVEG